MNPRYSTSLYTHHRNRFDEAKVILCKLRNLPEDHPDIANEFDQITSSVIKEKQQDGTKWKELIEPHNLRRLALGCFIQIAQQWTGTNVIVSVYSCCLSKILIHCRITMAL